jgi:hypothetical protein
MSLLGADAGSMALWQVGDGYVYAAFCCAEAAATESAGGIMHVLKH